MDGTFGMSKETGDFINLALTKGMKESDEGYGETLGKKIVAMKARNRNLSILAKCYDLEFQQLCMQRLVQISFISRHDGRRGDRRVELSRF